jgi:hypothetical protein
MSQRLPQSWLLGASMLVASLTLVDDTQAGCAEWFAKVPKLLTSAGRGVANYVSAYKPSNVGVKRFLMAPDREALETSHLGLVTIHNSDETLDFHEKLFRVQRNGKSYTLRPVEGLFKRHVSRLTRENARTGAQFIPTLPAYMLLSSVGVMSVTDRLFVEAENRARAASDARAEALLATYEKESYFLKDFRAAGLSSSDPEAKEKMKKIVAEVRKGRSVDLSGISDADLQSLATKLKGLVPDESSLDVNSFLTLTAFLGAEDGLEGLSDREKRALNAISFASGLETFKSKLLVLSDGFADDGGNFRYRGQEGQEPKALNMLDPKALRVFLDAASDHFQQLDVARHSDPHAEDAKPLRESEAYRELSARSSKFKDWVAQKNPSDASIAYYIGAQAEKERFYKLYEALGIQPQLQKNGEWVDIPVSAYEDAYPQWAEALK